MHKLVCDKCRRDDLAPLRPEWFEVKIQLPGRWVTIHLCEKCLGRFSAWIDIPDDQDVAA